MSLSNRKTATLLITCADRKGLVAAIANFLLTHGANIVHEQDVVRVSHRDDIDDLLQKGRDLEKITLSRAVRWHLEGRIVVYGNKTVVFD